jgi:Transposase DDE domain/DDE superfamily endonuclease
MKKHTAGSILRQAQRKATKRRRQAERERRQRARQSWPQVKAGRTAREPKVPPQARSYLVRQFWEHLRLGELLHKAGVKQKLKGLPAVTLMIVALTFGVYNANSVSDLATKAQADPVLLEACWAQGLERKQLYRFLGQVTDEMYLAWLGDMVRELQRDPRTATHRHGVVIGDDTTVFKSGKKMPYVTLVYQSSGQRFGLGNIIVSVHYADWHKDFPVCFDFWRPTPQQIQTAQDKRDRKRLKVDQRKPDDVARWIEHQVQQGQAPDLVILHGAQFGPVVVGKCEELRLAWIAIGGGRRQYLVVRPDGSRISGVSAQGLLTRRYRASEWVELTDVGYRVVLVGQADVDGIGCVSLLVAEDVADQARTLFVTRADSDEILLQRLELAVAQHADADTSRLQVMLRLLKLARQANVPAETAVFDRWFYVTGFITQVLALGFARVVTKAKRDIPYTYHGQTYTTDQLWRLIPAKRFRRQRIRGQWVKLTALHVWQEGLGHIKLVLVKELGAHNKILQQYALICTDVTFRNDQVYRAYKLRWKIEECYREVKQQHGLELYHARNFNANFGHVALSFLSYLCLVVTRLLTPKLRDKTLGQVKHLVFDAWVELEQDAHGFIVKFSSRFRREIGLPAFCT